MPSAGPTSASRARASRPTCRTARRASSTSSAGRTSVTTACVFRPDRLAHPREHGHPLAPRPGPEQLESRRSSPAEVGATSPQRRRARRRPRSCSSSRCGCGCAGERSLLVTTIISGHDPGAGFVGAVGVYVSARAFSPTAGKARGSSRPHPVGLRCHLLQVGLDEAVDIAVEHGVRVPHFNTRPVVLDHAIRMQHVGANLAAEGDVALAFV